MKLPVLQIALQCPGGDAVGVDRHRDATRDAQFLATRLGVPLVRLTSQAPAVHGASAGLAQFARIFEHNVAALEQSFAELPPGAESRRDRRHA